MPCTGALLTNKRSFRYGVWELQCLPKGAIQLPCKVVFKVKPDGRDPPDINKFKVRYCDKGFLQIKGLHYHNTYAPVTASLTVRLIVSIVNELGWPLHGMDVSNAYLNADLEEGIVLFVVLPPTVYVPKGWGLRLLKGSKVCMGPCREEIDGHTTNISSSST